MAEIHKLSVGQALEKLRGTDPPKTKMTDSMRQLTRLTVRNTTFESDETPH